MSQNPFYLINPFAGGTVLRTGDVVAFASGETREIALAPALQGPHANLSPNHLYLRPFNEPQMGLASNAELLREIGTRVQLGHMNMDYRSSDAPREGAAVMPQMKAADLPDICLSSGIIDGESGNAFRPGPHDRLSWQCILYRSGFREGDRRRRDRANAWLSGPASRAAVTAQFQKDDTAGCVDGTALLIEAAEKEAARWKEKYDEIVAVLRSGVSLQVEGCPEYVSKKDYEGACSSFAEMGEHYRQLAENVGVTSESAGAPLEMSFRVKALTAALRLGGRLTAQGDAVDALLDERRYQNTKWPAHAHTPGEWCLLLLNLASKAAETWKLHGNQPALNEIRQVGATALAAMEQCGAVRRGDAIAPKGADGSDTVKRAPSVGECNDAIPAVLQRGEQALTAAQAGDVRNRLGWPTPKAAPRGVPGLKEAALLGFRHGVENVASDAEGWVAGPYRDAYAAAYLAGQKVFQSIK